MMKKWLLKLEVSTFERFESDPARLKVETAMLAECRHGAMQ